MLDLGVDATVVVGAIELWTFASDAPNHAPDSFTLDSGPSSDGPWHRQLNTTAFPRGTTGWTTYALPSRAPQARYFRLSVAVAGSYGGRLRSLRFIRPDCGSRVADDGLIVWLDASNKDSFQGDQDLWRDVSGKFARRDSNNEILAPPYAIARGTIGLPMPLAAATQLQFDRMNALGLGALDKSGVAELTFKGRHA